MFGGLHPLTVLGSRNLGAPSSGSSVAPSTGPGGINSGQLQPNSRAQNMEAGVPYQLVPAYPPFVRIAADPNILYVSRTRTLIFGGNGVVAGTTTQQYQFSVPTIIIARTAAAIDASGAGLPVGRSGLDLFTVQFSRVGAASDLIDAGGGGAANPNVLVLGSSVLGTAAQPAFFPGQGLFVDTGGFLNVQVTVLRDNSLIHVTNWCLEEWGPARG
jgi:hypothetical protein